MHQDNSFLDMMARLRRRDGDAARVVFAHFARRLIELAHDQLDGWLRRKVDPEDVVQSVFRSFFRRYAAGEFNFVDWNSLWGLLTLMTIRKCINRAEYHRAERRDGQREVQEERDDEPAVLQALSREPTPAEAAILTDLVAYLLRGLKECDQPILTLSLDGYTVAEISSRIGRSERTIARRLDEIRNRLRCLEEGLQS